MPSSIASKKKLKSLIAVLRSSFVGNEGTVRCDEIYDFAQNDLLDDDVMLLDTFSAVFVWVGSHANASEQASAMSIAQEYISSATDGELSLGPRPIRYDAMVCTQNFKRRILEINLPLLLLTQGRESDVPIIRISAGSEPAMFTQYFNGWDSALAETLTYVDPYEVKRAALLAEKEKKRESLVSPPVVPFFYKDGCNAAMVLA